MRLHAARNAALASLRLIATPPLGPCVALGLGSPGPNERVAATPTVIFSRWGSALYPPDFDAPRPGALRPPRYARSIAAPDRHRR
jgi:hypothetical protein